MKHKFFRIAVGDAGEQEAELNAFCAQHRITHVEKYFVADAANSFWSICVTWVDSPGAIYAENKRKSKIDYREVLNEDDFNLYSQLRDLRKMIAEREGTPPYNIFTNEQLANIVKQRVITTTALLSLEGIGQTRVEKYGAEFMRRMEALIRGQQVDETGENNA